MEGGEMSKTEEVKLLLKSNLERIKKDQARFLDEEITEGVDGYERLQERQVAFIDGYTVGFLAAFKQKLEKHENETN